MNITVILVELGIMCLVFFVLVIGLLLISPLTFISDYPPEIQEQYYKSQNKESVKEQMTLAMKIKLSAPAICSIQANININATIPKIFLIFMATVIFSFDASLFCER